jgi:hypothetical protein
MEYALIAIGVIAGLLVLLAIYVIVMAIAIDDG